jgi:ligand-binding sensor domain-containing protein/signal transduction histidine kinase
MEGKDIRFTHLSTEQGLSQSRVDHMLQDRRGFIWIGTLNGLNRYDGYHFKIYKPVPNNPNSLGGLRVFAVLEDRSGILWIGVDQELDRFDPATETFTHFRADPDNRDSPSGYLEHMTQDRDGMLWLATRNGLDRLDPASGRFTHYRNDPNDPHSLTSNDVRFVLEDRQGTLWIAAGAGIDAFDRRTGRVLRHYPSSEQPPLDRMFEDRSGMLWVSATRGGGLASLDRKTGVFTRYIWFEGWPGTPGLRGCAAIHEDQDGMIWLATKPDGLVRFDRARRLFTRYRNNPGDPTSLNNDNALSLLEDREAGVWVGTDGSGVSRFPSEPSPFTVYRKEPGNPNSLDEENVASVFEDSKGILWIGTISQLNRLDRTTGRYTLYPHDPANPGSIATGVVRATVEDRAGYLWFGTWGGGLNRFDRRTGQFKAYRHDPADAASLSHDYVLSLLIDHEGNLWTGTDGGLDRLDARTGRFTHLGAKGGSMESRWYPVLAEGADGSIWMGTYTQGLQRLDVRTGEIVDYKYSPQVSGSLSNNQVHALCVDHAATLWVGTQGGLDRFDRNTGKFTTFGEADGLPNNAVEGILEDSAGNLWLSTSNGLSRFDPRTRTFRNYFSEDGLADNEFNDFSVYYKSPSGEMFFGGVNGVTAFYPERVVDRPFVPPVVLTDFRLFNDPVPVGGRSPLKKSISYSDSLTLSHAQNIFTLEFSALSFASPTRIRYRYRLEGLETHWNEASPTHRVVTYTTLPAGEYRFRVQSKDNRGSWSEPGLTLAIRVLPAWWNAWQFRTMAGALFALSLWLGHELRVRQLAQQFSIRLEERVGERTRIARELHDTLLQGAQGVLLRFQTVSELLPERPTEAKAKLDRAIEQTADFITEARDEVQGLRDSTIQTNDLALAINSLGEGLANDFATHGPVTFHVAVEGESRDLHPVVRDEIYKTATEALRNAFRHARARRIEVELHYDNEQFRLRMRDDGRGIDRAVLSGQASEGHYGLPGLRERAALIGGKLDVWSEVDSGTEVELRVPARTAYAPARRSSWWSRNLARKAKA